MGFLDYLLGPFVGYATRCCSTTLKRYIEAMKKFVILQTVNK
jgi:hypothetical protein